MKAKVHFFWPPKYWLFEHPQFFVFLYTDFLSSCLHVIYIFSFLLRKKSVMLLVQIKIIHVIT